METTTVLLLGLTFVLAVPGYTYAADARKVVEVVTVDTHGNTDAYLAAVKPMFARGRALAPEATVTA